MPLRCVIVDDNPLFLESAADLLGREGMDVVGVASDSAKAIRLVTELRPDVTLVDIDLGQRAGGTSTGDHCIGDMATRLTRQEAI